MEPIRIKSRSITLFVSAALLAMASAPALSSSHKEAPFIAGQQRLDGTDFYMFRSYAVGREDYVTFIANYIPFQDPQGGPNFNQFDSNGLYEIHVDNVGDGKEHLTYQFRFNKATKDFKLPVNGVPVRIPLINDLGVISASNQDALKLTETYTVDLVTSAAEGVRKGKRESVTQLNGSKTFTKPVDYIGEKSFGATAGDKTNYDAYANSYIYDIKIPNCAVNGKVFVGQRKESFSIAVGKIFDKVNLNPLGPEVGGNNNDLENKNISTIALEVPTACLVKSAAQPVIGGFTTASVRQGRLINPKPVAGVNNASKEGGAWAQVSRLGMPLVNEVVIGLEDKDTFNTSRPNADGQFLPYVTNPTLPTIIQGLFPGAPAPTKFPRNDLVATFLTGIFGLNQLNTVTASEMLRLNTSPTIPLSRRGAQNSLGVIAGDNSGFPNGRRPADDVVDVSLRVAMGKLCTLNDPADSFKIGCQPSDAPAGTAALTDGVRRSSTDFLDAFPYLNTPLPGNTN